MHTFTYRKILLYTLLLLVFKMVESLQCILNSTKSQKKHQLIVSKNVKVNKPLMLTIVTKHNNPFSHRGTHLKSNFQYFLLNFQAKSPPENDVRAERYFKAPMFFFHVVSKYVMAFGITFYKEKKNKHKIHKWQKSG